MKNTIEVRLLFVNSQSQQVTFVLEPWGETYPFDPEDHISLTFRGPEDGYAEVDQGSHEITVWGWSGSTAKLFKNGIELGAGKLERTPVPDMSGLNIKQPVWD